MPLDQMTEPAKVIALDALRHVPAGARSRGPRRYDAAAEPPPAAEPLPTADDESAVIRVVTPRGVRPPAGADMTPDDARPITIDMLSDRGEPVTIDVLPDRAEPVTYVEVRPDRAERFTRAEAAYNDVELVARTQVPQDGVEPVTGADSAHDRFRPDAAHDRFRPNTAHDRFAAEVAHDGFRPDAAHDRFRPDAAHDRFRPDAAHDGFVADAEAGAVPAPEHEPEPEAEPEEILSACPVRLDPATMREVINAASLDAVLAALEPRLDAATDNASRARLLGLRATVRRLLGDLDRALGDARLAAAHATATHQLRWIALAQARLARVHQWRGEYAEADRLYAGVDSAELPNALRAIFGWYAATSCYEQGRFLDACDRMSRVIDLRGDRDPVLVAAIEEALEAMPDQVKARGWGPARGRGQPRRARTGGPARPYPVWGAAGAMPLYAEVRPFQDGVAWVRRAAGTNWELIDEAGRPVTGPIFTAVGPFSDGLAWVSVDGRGWIAVDRTGSVAIPAKFDEVHAFVRDVAGVRRGPRWGAVDRTGRMVLNCEFDAMRTPLADGSVVDGFTSEGVAVVERGGRKGVADRDGEMIVPAEYHAVVVTPMAFLVATFPRRWGALDRRGDELLLPAGRRAADVLDELDRLIIDNRPIL